MGFNSPLLTVNIAQPGVLLGHVNNPAGGPFVRVIAGPYTLPINARAVAVYPRVAALPPGSTVTVSGSTSGVFYAYTVPMAGSVGGQVMCRVEPSSDPAVSVVVNFPAFTFGAAAPLFDVIALTDSGAVGVFAAPGMAPINAVPLASRVASAVTQVPGVHQIISPAAGTGQIRLWSSTLSAYEPTAGVAFTAELIGHNTGTVYGYVRGVGAGQVFGSGVGGGLLMATGDGLDLVVAGAGCVADTVVVYDNAS